MICRVLAKLHKLVYNQGSGIGSGCFLGYQIENTSPHVAHCPGHGPAVGPTEERWRVFFKADRAFGVPKAGAADGGEVLWVSPAKSGI